jgi:HEPN domain-containing protein
VTDIEQIQQKIAKIYQAIEVQPVVNVPPTLQVRQWASFAKDYIAAASIVEKEAPQHWLPVLQMTGQAIESSLKACLVAANTEPPNQHNLVNLYRLAAELGFQLADSDMAAIIHLQHFYFQDLATGTRYKARYPTNISEPLGGAVPSNATFVSIIHSLIEQAEQKIDGDEPNG